MQQSAFEKEMFEVFCPNLAVEVVTNALAQNSTKGDSAALIVKAFAHRYFAQPIDNMYKPIGLCYRRKGIVRLEYLFKSTPQQIAYVYKAGFALGKRQLGFIDRRGYFFPNREKSYCRLTKIRSAILCDSMNKKR